MVWCICFGGSIHVIGSTSVREEGKVEMKRESEIGGRRGVEYMLDCNLFLCSLYTYSQQTHSSIYAKRTKIRHPPIQQYVFE